jgi:hypothetical protein
LFDCQKLIYVLKWLFDIIKKSDKINMWGKGNPCRDKFR